ncbi:hypothetical protein ACOMHN_028286 [Nucella lapillus]
MDYDALTGGKGAGPGETDSVAEKRKKSLVVRSRTREQTTQYSQPHKTPAAELLPALPVLAGNSMSASLAA